jgi:MFS family permease
MIKNRSGLFYGWRIVLASALAMLFGSIPIVVYAFGVFLKPLARDFHAGRAAISFAFTLHNIAVASATPIAGWLTDRFGARKVILSSTLVLGIVLVSNSLSTSNTWELYAFFAVVGLFEAGVGPIPYSKVISRWFDRKRGLALALMILGFAFGALVMPSFAQYLIGKGGWRFAYATMGASSLLVSLPLVACFLKERPEALNLLPDGASARESKPFFDVANVGVDRSEALHTSAFWLLLASVLLVSSSLHACLTHLPAILADRGSTPQAAALASSVLGAGVLLGRTCSGILMDRFFAPYVAAITYAGAGAAIGLFRLAGSQELAFTAALFIGIAFGAESDILAYLISRYFGLRSFGAIYGVIFSGFLLAGAFGTFIMGAAFDARHSYALPLSLFCLAAVTGAAFMTCLGPYRYKPPATSQDLAAETSFGQSVSSNKRKAPQSSAPPACSRSPCDRPDGPISQRSLVWTKLIPNRYLS